MNDAASSQGTAAWRPVYWAYAAIPGLLLFAFEAFRQRAASRVRLA